VSSPEIEFVGLNGPLSNVLALVEDDIDLGETGGDGIMPGA
jgi:hypothetical protein